MEIILENRRIVAQELSKLCLPTNNGYIFIYPEDIVYCQSYNAYSYLFTTDGEKTFITIPLKELENILRPEDFPRVHKSFIVNINRVKRYVKNGLDHLIMEHEERIPISRNKKKDILKLLMDR